MRGIYHFSPCGSPILNLISANFEAPQKKIYYNFWNADVFDVEWCTSTTEIREQMVKSVSHGRMAATPKSATLKFDI